MLFLTCVFTVQNWVLCALLMLFLTCKAQRTQIWTVNTQVKNNMSKAQRTQIWTVNTQVKNNMSKAQRTQIWTVLYSCYF
jgi:hypothetical protein